MTSSTVKWTEPAGLRRELLSVSGGLRAVFLRELRGTAIPIFATLLLVWLVALGAGVQVMGFFRSVGLFALFGMSVAMLLTLLYQIIPGVQLTEKELTIGPLKWRAESIDSYAWEKRVFGGVEYCVLNFFTRRGNVMVALPSDLSPATVNSVLNSWGKGKAMFES
jgi:hypothetical protein